MPDFKRKLELVFSEEIKIEQSQGDGWRITTPYGYIDYRHRHEDSVNEIWWVESKKRGHGSYLVDLMQQYHPAEAIAWGVTSASGAGLMRKWHTNHPDIACITGPHEGQFDPFGNSEEEEEEEFME